MICAERQIGIHQFAQRGKITADIALCAVFTSLLGMRYAWSRSPYREKKRKRCEREGGHSRLRKKKKKIFNLCHKAMDGSAPISRLKGTLVCTDGQRKKCGESEEKTSLGSAAEKKQYPSGPEHLQVTVKKNDCFCVQT